MESFLALDFDFSASSSAVGLLHPEETQYERTVLNSQSYIFFERTLFV